MPTRTTSQTNDRETKDRAYAALLVQGKDKVESFKAVYMTGETPATTLSERDYSNIRARAYAAADSQKMQRYMAEYRAQQSMELDINEAEQNYLLQAIELLITKQTAVRDGLPIGSRGSAERMLQTMKKLYEKILTYSVSTQ